VGFDKTGTLTSGKFRVARVTAMAGYTENELLAIVASVEKPSRHPLALSLVSTARERDLSVDRFKLVGDPHAVPGFGVQATVTAGEQPVSVCVGNLEFVQRHASGRPNIKPEDGTTLVWVACDGIICGCIDLEDSVRKESPTSVAALGRMGMSTALLSGDGSTSVERVAKICGIDPAFVFAQMRPSEKLATLRKLRAADGSAVGFVGDGVNDSLALAECDLSVALSEGSDLAEQASQVVVSGHSPISKIPALFLIARRTMATVRQNLMWALLYNACLIPIAAGALLPAFGIVLPPVLCGAAMGFSSISVVLNCLRLRHGLSRRALFP